MAPTSVWGPLPSGMVSLILGRSILLPKAFLFSQGSLTQTIKGKLKSCLKFLVIILFLARCKLPSCSYSPRYLKDSKYSETQNTERGFSSTDNQSIFWTESIKLNKPILQIKIKDKTFQGLIDTGANIAIISNQFWPPQWPLTDSRTPVTGVGGVSQPQVSVWSLKCY